MEDHSQIVRFVSTYFGHGVGITEPSVSEYAVLKIETRECDQTAGCFGSGEGVRLSLPVNVPDFKGRAL